MISLFKISYNVIIQNIYCCIKLSPQICNVNYIEVDKEKSQHYECMCTINSFFSHLTITINCRNILSSLGISYQAIISKQGYFNTRSCLHLFLSLHIEFSVILPYCITLLRKLLNSLLIYINGLIGQIEIFPIIVCIHIIFTAYLLIQQVTV